MTDRNAAGLRNGLNKVLSAAQTAARWHAKQRRKGSAGEPYFNHLLEVAALVNEAAQGEDTDLVVAALLHDAVEDQGISRETIAEEFGEDVAGLVMEVTDDKSLEERCESACRSRRAQEVTPDEDPETCRQDQQRGARFGPNTISPAMS